MKRLAKSMLYAASLTLFPALAFAQEITLGQQEYEANCAVCHGASGKGDGPLSGFLTQKVTDLTVLSKNNGGVFPFNEVYEIVDGRRMVKGHGTRDMPVWGREYSAQAGEYYKDFPRAYNPEVFIRGRILALLAHVYELQAK